MIKRIVLLVATTCIFMPSITFSESPKITKEQKELIKKIKTSKSAIEQARQYKLLWENLNKLAELRPDLETQKLQKKKDALEAELKADLNKYNLSTLWLQINSLLDQGSMELISDIKELERVKEFIRRIKNNPKMEKAFLLAKRSGIEIQLANHFKVEVRGHILIDYQAPDEKVVEFLLGPENGGGK